MQIDLALVADLCRELDFECVQRSPDELAVHLEAGVVLLFVDLPPEDDSLVGFDGTAWHYHGTLTCVDRRGEGVELDYLDVVTCLADGALLLCEQWLRGELADRWLVHREFMDEVRFLRDDEEVRIRAVSRRGREGTSAS